MFYNLVTTQKNTIKNTRAHKLNEEQHFTKEQFCNRPT